MTPLRRLRAIARGRPATLLLLDMVSMYDCRCVFISRSDARSTCAGGSAASATGATVSSLSFNHTPSHVALKTSGIDANDCLSKLRVMRFHARAAVALQAQKFLDTVLATHSWRETTHRADRARSSSSESIVLDSLRWLH